MDRRKGQGTLEYILVLLAILLAVIAGASGPITNAVGSLFSDVNTAIDEAGDKIANIVP